MSRHTFRQEEIKLVEELHQQIEDYFRKNWVNGWLLFGTNFTGFENVHNKNAFFLRVQEQIDTKLNDRYGLKYAAANNISIDSIRRFLLKEKLSFDKRTLNAFLLLIDSPHNWQQYKVEGFGKHQIAQTNLKSNSKFIWGGIAILVLLSGFMVYLFSRNTSSPEPEFSVALIDSEGFPKRVKVSYDFTNVPFCEASFFFDIYNVALKANKGDTIVSTSLPKYSMFKLFVDGKQNKEVKLNIPSEGWIGVLNNRIPLKQESFIRNDVMQVIMDKSYQKTDEDFYTSFMNFRDFQVSGDAFQLEADIMNNKGCGGIWAYDISVDIVGSESSISFNLLSPDATQYLVLKAGNTDFRAGKNVGQVQNLGVKLDNWKHLVVSAKDQRLFIKLDKKLLFEGKFEGEIGNIQGLQLYAKGSGAFKKVQLKDLQGQNEKLVSL